MSTNQSDQKVLPKTRQKVSSKIPQRVLSETHQKVQPKRILITSPSLDVKDNVSGISSLVKDIIIHSRLNFVHFQLGSKDGSKKNVIWAVDQVYILIKFLFTSVFKGYEMIHLNVGLEKFSIIRDSMIFFIVKNTFRKKVILHVHGGYFLMNEPRSKVLSYLLKKIFKHAKTIIVLSDLEKDILTKRYGKLPFHVFPNAVDTSLMNGFSKPASNGAGVRFVFMGRINKTKGIYTISESMKYLEKYFDRFSLDIYGAGLEKDTWMDSLQKYKGLRFSFNGVVGGTDKWEALINSDVLLLPALHSEGMPIAMIEAMASGCLVIVTDVASVKSIVENDRNGILLSESCPIQLARKMEEIIEGKIDVKTIGQNARDYVQANLSLSGYIKKLENLYSTL